MNTPKFKEGDWIKRKKDGSIARIVMLLKTCYDLRLTDGDCWWLDYDFQDNWELTDAPPKNDLEEAADKHIRKVADTAGHPGWDWTTQDIADAFIAGAKWQANQLLKGSPLPEDTVLFQKGVEEGKRLMMEDAVEGEIGYWNQRGLSIRLDKSLERLGYDMDTKVKIIIVKQDDGLHQTKA